LWRASGRRERAKGPLEMKRNIPPDLRYTTEHVWVRLETAGTETIGRYRLVGGTQVRLGITPAGRSRLGDAVEVELPNLGARLTRMKPFLTLTTTAKERIAFPLPVPGEVVALNEELTERPEKLEHDPFGSGWVVVITPHDLAPLEGLLSAAEYEGFLGSSSSPPCSSSSST
jgi:glycine cleavage system H protein